MDANLIVIFTFVLLVASMAFAMAHRFHRRVVDHEERKLELLARVEEAKKGDAGSGVDRDTHRKLEERVRVLERIATDSNHALATQIDQLHDLHEIEDQTKAREKAQ